MKQILCWFRKNFQTYIVLLKLSNQFYNFIKFKSTHKFSNFPKF